MDFFFHLPEEAETTLVRGQFLFFFLGGGVYRGQYIRMRMFQWPTHVYQIINIYFFKMMNYSFKLTQ